jgi:hypothetical protein
MEQKREMEQQPETFALQLITDFSTVHEDYRNTSAMIRALTKYLKHTDFQDPSTFLEIDDNVQCILAGVRSEGSVKTKEHNDVVCYRFSHEPDRMRRKLVPQSIQLQRSITVTEKLFHWYVNNGTKIQKQFITPTICLEDPDIAIGQITCCKKTYLLSYTFCRLFFILVSIAVVLYFFY